MNKDNFIETTTKFNELKKEFNNDYYAKRDYACDTDPKISALKTTMDKLLILLDELVRS